MLTQVFFTQLCKFQVCSHFTCMNWRHCSHSFTACVRVYITQSKYVIHTRNIFFFLYNELQLLIAQVRAPTNPTELTDRAITHILRSVVPCKMLNWLIRLLGVFISCMTTVFVCDWACKMCWCCNTTAMQALGENRVLYGNRPTFALAGICSDRESSVS